MRRISTPTAAQDLFGPGKHGFRNGDPANAILATRLQAEWFNALQEEVARAVEVSGEGLDPEDNGQLSAAIESVVGRKAPVATKAEAETNDEATADNVKRMTPLRVLQAIKARLINATEAVVGMLRVGTQAEVNAGALDNVTVTPKKLRWGFSSSFAGTGYIVFPTWLGGFIIQWGLTNANYNQTSVTVTFPLAFPNACLNCGATVANAAAVSGIIGAFVHTLTTTTFQILGEYDTAAVSGIPTRWFAFGH